MTNVFLNATSLGIIIVIKSNIEEAIQMNKFNLNRSKLGVIYWTLLIVLLAMFLFGLIISFSKHRHHPKIKITRHPQELSQFLRIKSSRGNLTNSLLYPPLDLTHLDDNLTILDQKDLRLIQYTRVRYLTPPSKFAYNIKKGTGDNESESGEWIRDFFQNKREGLFIEAAARDGVIRSHTLYFEQMFGWTGVLVECDPQQVPTLRRRHRKAWIAEVCLSTDSHPGTVR